MAYQATLKIQPNTLTDLTVNITSNVLGDSTLTLSDFTVVGDNLEASIKYNQGDTMEIISTGYQTQTLNIYQNISNIITLNPLEFSNIETNSIKYYCKDETARNSITDINTTLDGKVNKAGDTMSGTLQMSSSVSPQIIIKDTSQVAGTTPTGTEQAMAISFKDSNDLLLGYVQNVYGTDGSRVSMLNSRNADGTARTNIIVGYNASGTAYCSFPNTECVDGQWVYKNTSLGSGVTWNTSSHSGNKSYSLSSYLPNDGKDYEVIVKAQGTTPSTSGKFISIGILSDIITTQVYVCRCRTRSSSTVNCSGNVVIPVGTDRKIYVNGCGSTEANADGTYDIACLGYRRIGTNS